MKKSRLTLQGHEQKDIERFTVLENKIPSHEDIKVIVHSEINGNFEEIKNHLSSQDITMKALVWLAKGILGGIGLVIVGVIVNFITMGKI